MSEECEKKTLASDMTMKEAEYWLARLRGSLRVIGAAIVKYIALESAKCDYGAKIDPDREIPVRPMNFEGGDYFDRTRIDHLYIYGYLPIKNEKPRIFYRDEIDKGTMMYQVFMNYIHEFLRDVFGLYADVHNAEIISCERWKIPVEPITRPE